MMEIFALLAFAVAQGVFLLWSRRTPTAALVFATLSFVVAAGAIEALSQPKPMNLEWRSPDEADVLWYELREGQSIRILLSLNGEPRFYVMPWNQEQAEQLQKAGVEAADTGGTLKMELPFESSLAPPERLFYTLPQPSPPPKG